jgi:hypothetical protein
VVDVQVVPTENMRRSQAILRMPIDSICALLLLHDGDRSEVMLFLQPGEDVARLVCGSELFLPVVRNGRVCVVARAAIAALGIPARLARTTTEDLPVQHQSVAVTLRSGTKLDGELRWNSPTEKQKTIEFLNGDASYVVVHTEETAWFVLKSHVATVSEK